MESQQMYHELKSKYPEHIILLRCGDYYETYAEDAEIVARVCVISVSEIGGEKYSCFTHFSLDSYLPKLIRARQKVAICDYIEQPLPEKKRSISEM